MAIGFGDVTDFIFGDVFSPALLSDSKLDKLFVQKGDFKQFTEIPTDITEWKGPSDQTSPEYFFLLRSGGTITQVPFNLNPTHETVTEPHAMTIKYTQGGGKVVQSEGAITKDINIRGTTGLYPGSRRARLPDSGVGSGLEAFKLLETVLRRYMFLKRFGDLSESLQLIYVNRRRQESWIVEPKTFTSEDAIEHNFHFHYNIVLETMAPYDGKDSKGLMDRIFDASSGWRDFNNMVQRLSEAIDQLNAAAGLLSSFIDGFIDTILKPLISLANTFADIVDGRLPNFANFSRDSTKSLVLGLREIQAALGIAGEDELAATVAEAERRVRDTLLADDVYEKSPISTSKAFTKSQNQQVTNFVGNRGVSVSPDEAIAAGAPTFRPPAAEVFGGNALGPDTSNPGTATGAAEARASDESDRFETSATVGGSLQEGKQNVTNPIFPEVDPAQLLPPTTGQISSQLNWDASWDEALQNIDPANVDYRTQRVDSDDDIQTLAFKVLGEHARWPELVLLNNLKFPYIASQAFIDANNLSNVLAFGNDVIFPVPKETSTIRSIRQFRNENAQSLSLSPFERALGSDILVSDETKDVVYTANDLTLVMGVDNLGQFVRKRVTIPRGLYRRSKRVGFTKRVGTSADVDVAIIKAEGEGLFFDDERISSTQVLEVRKEGGNLLKSMSIKVRNQQDPLIVTAKVPC